MKDTLTKLFSQPHDPCKSCELYKDKGCAHVDGMLCDFPKCSMNLNYIDEKEKK